MKTSTYICLALFLCVLMKPISAFSDNRITPFYSNITQQQPIEIGYISSTKELRIKTANAIEIQDIRLFSVLGKKVKHWKNLKSNSQGTLKVPVSNISEGTYIVSVKTKAGITNKRLIISH